MGSLSIWHWLIVLLVVVLIFGTKKLRNMGGDVGGAIKEFKTSMADAKAPTELDAEADVSAVNKLSDTAVVVPAKAPVKRKVATKTTATKATTAKAPASKATAAKKPATTKVATASKTPAKTAAKKPATKATAKPKATA